jgi:hypothetical protein
MGVIKLSAFENWMVEQNVKYARQEVVQAVTDRLRAGGYNRVADEVSRHGSSSTLGGELMADQFCRLADRAETPQTIKGTVRLINGIDCDTCGSWTVGHYYNVMAYLPNDMILAKDNNGRGIIIPSRGFKEV